MRFWDPITRRDREDRPPAMAEIAETARRLLDDAGVVRVFPTPIAPVARALGLTEEIWPPIKIIDSYAARLPLSDAEALHSALKKTFGWKCGGRFSVNPWFVGPRRVRKAAFHEIGHEALPWHHVMELTTAGHDAFDVEANAFADELIFQGTHFDAQASSMATCIESVNRLAELYQAPWHDTLVRFVEHRREPLVLLISDGDSQRVVAAAASAIALGLDQGVGSVDTKLVATVEVGLKIVGVRRYELLMASGPTAPRRLRLVA